MASNTIDALIAEGERRRDEELVRNARRNVLIADYIQREKSYADTWDCGCTSSGLTGRLYKACDEHAAEGREDNAKADANSTSASSIRPLRAMTDDYRARLERALGHLTAAHEDIAQALDLAPTDLHRTTLERYRQELEELVVGDCVGTKSGSYDLAHREA